MTELETKKSQKSQRKAMTVFLWLLVFVGLGASGYSAGRRWRVETRNRAVEIVLDFPEIREIAGAEGKTVGAVLKRFKEAGATSVAVQEDSIAGLAEQKRIEMMSAQSQNAFNLSVSGQETVSRVMSALKAKIPAGFSADTSDPTAAFLTVHAPYAVVRTLGVGLDPRTVCEIKKAHLSVVGRVFNYQGATPENIRWTLANLKSAGAHSVLFAGEDVLGYKKYLLDDPEKPQQASTASLLRLLGLTVGIVEFSKMKGLDALANERAGGAADFAVRVHTLTGAEMANAEAPATIQRFLLAARERNIRQLFVHLFPDESPLLETNAKFIEDIVTGLNRGNLTPGLAHGYAPLSTPLWVRGLIGVGVAAALLLLILGVTGGLGGVIGVVGVLLALGLAALPCLPDVLGVKVTAFAAAYIYPSLALLYVDWLRPNHKSRVPVLVALGRFLLISAITSLGIAAIVGLLADRLFLIKADEFAGIKAAQIVPLALVVLIVGLNLRADEYRTFHNAANALRRRAFDFAGQPVRYWQLLALGAGVLVFLLLLDRSGNDSGVGVSALELKFRSLLDRFLYARPRFKEFLIGHPAMILALIFAVQGRRQWAIPLFILGSIGQISLLNTFCHLHTPLLVSLWRALLGLGIGAVIGLAAYGAVRSGVGAPGKQPGSGRGGKADSGTRKADNLHG